MGRSTSSRVAALVGRAREHRFALVHVSSDYVFDGTRETHPEDEPFSPARGLRTDQGGGRRAASTALPRHYLVRTSWVVGDGKNFVEHHGARWPTRGVAPRWSTTSTAG